MAIGRNPHRFASARSSSPTCTWARPAARPKRLLDFLRRTESEYLYLVGDIVDGWQLKRRWYWHQSHNDVVQKVLRKARKGTRVDLRPRQPRRGGAPLRRARLRRHRDPRRGGRTSPRAGARLLVTHGDLFDAVVQCAKWLALARRPRSTRSSLKLNQHFNAMRARLGLPLLVAVAVPQAQGEERGELHHRVRGRRSRTRRGAAASTASSAATSTRPRSATIDGILYCNDGDWVESLTALVEPETAR